MKVPQPRSTRALTIHRGRASAARVFGLAGLIALIGSPAHTSAQGLRSNVAGIRLSVTKPAAEDSNAAVDLSSTDAAVVLDDLPAAFDVEVQLRTVVSPSEALRVYVRDTDRRLVPLTFGTPVSINGLDRHFRHLELRLVGPARGLARVIEVPIVYRVRSGRGVVSERNTVVRFVTRSRK